MKIAWAVDIFGAGKKDTARVGRFLKLFAPKKADLYALYVATPQEPQIVTAFDIPESERFGGYPLSLLKTAMKKTGISVGPRNHHVVFSATFSLSKAADDLCKAVKRLGTDLIALQTHQRKGLQRAMLGSFSETILHRSKHSLLMVNPWHRLPNKIDNILFADDLLSPVSAKGRHFVSALATQFSAEVSVVYADYFYSYGKERNIARIDDYRRRIDRLLKRSQAYFRRRGITVSGSVVGNNQGAAEAILAAAGKENADIIVISSKSGLLRALLGGSVARKIVRQSVRPVIIYKS